MHGRWRENFDVESERDIRIGDHRIGSSDAATPDAIAWADLGCDIVLECTGKFLKIRDLESFFARGVKTVIVAAPVKEAGALNIVVGVNDHRWVTPKCRGQCPWERPD